MDKIIGSYPATENGDLMFCNEIDIAYQKDMSESVAYDKDYFEKYINYEGTPIAKNLNSVRTALVSKYCHGKDTLDIGIGSGEFIKSSPNKVYGYDINQYGIAWLKERELFIDPWVSVPKNIVGITLWDALEHMKNPSDFLRLVPWGCIVFVSMPMFEDIKNLRSSKHYKPNEHYYYYSPNGFAKFADDAGFKVLEINDGETSVGRESIFTFVLVQTL